MDRASFQADDEVPIPIMDDDPAIDYEDDQMTVRNDVEDDESEGDLVADDPERRIDNAELDNTLDELVDLVNGRDLDGLSELLASDAEAEFLRETSADGVIDGLNDLFLRYPTLLVTRGDIGSEPIVAVWIFDRDADRFDPFGYIALEMTDSGDPQIQRVVYSDELPNHEGVVVETPDRSELPEWEDWSQLDED